MTLNFEDLFAIRIAYQDMYNDESDIIRELKKELIRDGMNINDIDDFLVNFYKNYGINMSKEIISSVIIPTRRGPRIRLTDLSGNNILNFLLNPGNLNNSVNLVNNTLNSELNQVNVNDSDDNSSLDSEDNSSLVSDDDIPELESDTDSDMPELEEISNNNSSESNLDPPLVQFYSGYNFTHGIIPPVPSNNGNSNSNLSNIFNSIDNVSANSFLQSFLNIMNLQQQNMEDVRATLGKEGEKEIKNYKLKEDLDGTCSVCMMKLEKTQEVSELKCKHVFHKECIMKWLKEYNYKCPVCRAECGKPKFNLNDNEN